MPKFLKALIPVFSRGSQKQGFKTDPKPYHTVGDVSRVRFPANKFSFYLINVTSKAINFHSYEAHGLGRLLVNIV